MHFYHINYVASTNHKVEIRVSHSSDISDVGVKGLIHSKHMPPLAQL